MYANNLFFYDLRFLLTFKKKIKILRCKLIYLIRLSALILELFFPPVNEGLKFKPDPQLKLHYFFELIFVSGLIYVNINSVFTSMN